MEFTFFGIVFSAMFILQKVYLTQTILTPELKQNNRIVKKVPKGTSEYQSSWILEDDGDHSEKDNESDEDSTGEMMEDEVIAEMKDDSSDESVCTYICACE
jgi:hypothetical protein